MTLLDPTMKKENMLPRLSLATEYPGQTMMVAYAIMIAFPSLSEAQRKPEGKEFKNALTCQQISGAGCAVHGALNALQRGKDQNLSGDSLIDEMDKYWSEYAGHQECYKDRVEPGLKKAKPFREGFKRLWETWKNN